MQRSDISLTTSHGLASSIPSSSTTLPFAIADPHQPAGRHLGQRPFVPHTIASNHETTSSSSDYIRRQMSTSGSGPDLSWDLFGATNTYPHTTSHFRSSAREPTPRLQEVPVPFDPWPAVRAHTQLRQSMENSGMSSAEISSATTKAAPLFSCNADGTYVQHDIPRESWGKRFPLCTLFCRVADSLRVELYVGLLFLFDSDKIRQDLIAQHTSRSFQSTFQTSSSFPDPSLSSTLSVAVPQLLKLPVILTLKLFQQFTGELVLTDLCLHHFVLPGAAWDSVSAYSEAVENLVSVACLVFGSHMDEHFGGPLRAFLLRARGLSQVVGYDSVVCTIRHQQCPVQSLVFLPSSLPRPFHGKPCGSCETWMGTSLGCTAVFCHCRLPFCCTFP